VAYQCKPPGIRFDGTINKKRADGGEVPRKDTQQATKETSQQGRVKLKNEET
jgi:hypothetical protein